MRLRPAHITVLSDGTFTGIEETRGRFAGTATARTQGNVFDPRLIFGGAPCLLPGSTFQEILSFDLPTLRLHTAALGMADD